ncbi:EpsG family protein [Carnobacterium antarcticum]|uniref:EpsG family protein n=1 Tax=Carnobacterium antarcticum TaxID=2126436 RepID=A0ABW4NJR6_9LACT|nr:EpsG family protein [Carnobacterium sp. CP1]ALV21538.1 capsular polysaccharide biosynthesis protein [Carnobacterium sp. CP1]
MYYLIYLYGLLGSLKSKKNKFFFITFLLILIILSFVRYGIGPDYFSYNFLYERLSISPIQEFKYGIDNQEILFRVLGSTLKNIGLSYQQYLGTLAIISLYFITKTCWKFSHKPYMSLFLYYSFFYFVWTFSGLRQGLTISIGMYYFLKFKSENKNIKFFIMIIILSQIHYSIIVLIPLYYLSNINWSKKGLTNLSAVSIFISLLPIGKVIPLISGIPVINRIVPYVNVNYSILNVFDFQSFARIFFLIMGIWYYDQFTKINYKSKIIMNTYILSIDIYFILKFSETTASRLSIYGFYLLILILPNIYSLYNKKKNKIIFQLLIILLTSTYFLKEIITMGSNAGIYSENFYVPYTNIYNKDDYVFKSRYLDLE